MDLSAIILIRVEAMQCITEYRGVEQLVARRAHNPEVASSSLVPATTKRNHPTGWFLYCFQNCADSKKEPDDKNRQTSFFIMQQDCFT